MADQRRGSGGPPPLRRNLLALAASSPVRLDRNLLEKQRVLIRCYHGLGDTLQYIRFAAPLRGLARQVTVWAQPELVELVATAPGVDRVLPLHQGSGRGRV